MIALVGSGRTFACEAPVCTGPDCPECIDGEARCSVCRVRPATHRSRGIGLGCISCTEAYQRERASRGHGPDLPPAA